MGSCRSARLSRHPYALLYHQTMSFLVSAGEVSAAALAQNVLGLSVFHHISQDDYRLLLQHLISIEHLQKTERSGLIIGKKAENIVAHYEFYSVFESPVEYLVKEENMAIGTVMESYPAGTRFALAGRAWECVEVNEKSKVIFVRPVHGISKVSWTSKSESDLHTKLLRKMRDILIGDEQYSYLSGDCKKRLEQIRDVAKQSGITSNIITPLSSRKYAIYPWLGTRQLSALFFALEQKGIKCRV